MPEPTPPHDHASGHDDHDHGHDHGDLLTLEDRHGHEAEIYDAMAEQLLAEMSDEEFLVQDLVVQARTVLYRRERWLSATGETSLMPHLVTICRRLRKPGAKARASPNNASTSDREWYARSTTARIAGLPNRRPRPPC